MEKLRKKDEIDYGDIAHAKTVSNIEMVSYFKTEKESDYIGDYYEEMLFVQSKYFNMKAICEKAGICYSTYRGFKNNHQYFSTEKKLTLLRCMYDVGTNCMSKEMKND